MASALLSAQTINAIRAAQGAWAAQSMEHRARVLKAIGDHFAARGEEVAEIVCRETKKAPADAWFADVVPNLELFSWWTGKGLDAIKAWKAPLSPLTHPGKSAVLHYEPKGLVGLITPWNYPAALPLRSLVPALMAGNAVLFKPSEVTPKTGDLIAEIFQNYLPGGVLTVVHGQAEAGEAIIDAADTVVFTGSVATGRKVAMRCAERMIPVSLELGGKDAAIVLRDCDLERTAAGIFWGAMSNSGQNCASIERVYAERQVYDALVARLADLVRQNPVAPVATQAQDATVKRHLDDATAKGATLHGEYPGGGVIVTGMPQDSLIMTEETFGPVCPVLPVDSSEEALQLANDSAFGLTTSIWSDNEARARSLAGRADSGVVTINNHAFTGSMPFAPWSGRGLSGHGVTNSHLAMLEFVQPKFILHDNNADPELWWFPLDQAAVDLARKTLKWMSSKGFSKAARTIEVLKAARERTKQVRNGFRT